MPPPSSDRSFLAACGMHKEMVRLACEIGLAFAVISMVEWPCYLLVSTVGISLYALTVLCFVPHVTVYITVIVTPFDTVFFVGICFPCSIVPERAFS